MASANFSGEKRGEKTVRDNLSRNNQNVQCLDKKAVAGNPMRHGEMRFLTGKFSHFSTITAKIAYTPSP